MYYNYDGTEVKKYPNLVGDGVADDTVALQAIVDTETYIRIPESLTIKLTGAIVIDPDKVKLFDGGNSLFVQAGGDKYCFWIKGSMTTGMTANPETLTDKELISESGFTIKNCKCTSTENTGAAIALEGCINATVTGIYAVRMKKGIVIRGVNRNLNIYANNLYVMTECGIHIMNSVSLHQFNIVDNIIQYMKYCLFLDNPDDIANMQLTGNTIEIATYPNNPASIERCILITSDNVKSGQLSEIEIVGNTIQGHGLSDNIIEIYGGTNRYIAHLSISGNHISNSAKVAVKLTKTKTVALGHNTFKSVLDFCYSLAGCINTAISGDACDSVNGFVEVDASSSNVAITGNSGQTLSNAFDIDASATGVFKANNVFNGSVVN